MGAAVATAATFARECRIAKYHVIQHLLVDLCEELTPRSGQSRAETTLNRFTSVPRSVRSLRLVLVDARRRLQNEARRKWTFATSAIER